MACPFGHAYTVPPTLPPGARRPGQAQGRASARAAGRPLREGRRADHQAPQGREDHRPADLAVGPGRPADPQGQALTAQPIRLRRSALRDHRQHQAGRTRVHPPALKPDRQPGRGHAAAGHRSRAAEPRHQAARGDGRRRVQPGPDQHRARGPGRRGATSPAARNPAPGAPAAADSATAPAQKDGSATSNAATACAAAASKATKATRSGTDGRPSPTTPTPTPPSRKETPLTGRGTGEDPAGSSRKDDHPSTTRPPAPPFLTPSASAAAFIRGK